LIRKNRPAKPGGFCLVKKFNQASRHDSGLPENAARLAIAACVSAKISLALVKPNAGDGPRRPLILRAEE
jgi:hypothetical protein